MVEYNPRNLSLGFGGTSRVQLDVELRGWSAAGLEKPSVARLNRLVTAEKSLLTKYLGRLASSDAAAIKAAWNQNLML